MRIFLAVLFCFLTNVALATPSHQEFKVPEELRPRVDFWIGVFAIYTQQHAIFHHRDYPQAVFDVVDYNWVAEKYGRKTAAYDVTVNKAKAEHTAKIRKIISELVEGRNDGSKLAEQIETAMEYVPGGKSKYLSTVTEDKVRSQTGIKEKFEEAIILSGRYMPIIENIFVNEFNLPKELTRLPFVESSFNYKAYSSVGAAGIWQFMRSTAKGYMRVDNLIDERRDVISATRAAAKYMRSAHKALERWPLAVTSYNHGVGGVRGKVKKMGSRDISYLIEHPTNQLFGFASNNFFPELLAANEVYDNREKYFPGIKVEPALQVTEYPISNDTSVQHIMTRLDVSLEELKQYNYGISDAIWQGRYKIPKNYVLKVPSKYKSKVVSLKAPEPTSGSASVVYGVGTYNVRSGDTLAGIASRHELTVKQLKQLNNLNSDTVRIGQKLNVAPRESAIAVLKEQDIDPLPTMASGTHLVKYRETLGSIAVKYGMTVADLKSLNGLSANVIKEGQQLKVQERIPAAPIISKVANTTATTHKVAPGDTLWSISNQYKVSITDIRQLNKITGTGLKIGQEIKVRK